jgi:hypothetical protein
MTAFAGTVDATSAPFGTEAGYTRPGGEPL